jgi:5-methylcytosine-specific restriction endonuclease McrA
LKKTFCFDCGTLILYRISLPQRCKTCRKIFKKKYIADWKKRTNYKINKEKYKISHKNWKKNHPEYYKNYYKKTYPHHSSLQKKYYLENREEILSNGKKRNKTPEGKLKKILLSIKRRERLKNVRHNFSYDEWMKKIEKTNGVCPVCKKFVGKEKMTLDHTIPISKAPKGFIYTLNDVSPMCHSCNCKKGKSYLGYVRNSSGRE